MNNFFKINYDLYDQWLIVIDHRLFTILILIENYKARFYLFLAFLE